MGAAAGGVVAAAGDALGAEEAGLVGAALGGGVETVGGWFGRAAAGAPVAPGRVGLLGRRRCQRRGGQDGHGPRTAVGNAAAPVISLGLRRR